MSDFNFESVSLRGDTVILTFSPVTGNIVSVSSAGNLIPCNALLTVGASAVQAINCLERSGFQLQAFNTLDGTGIVYTFVRVGREESGESRSAV